MSKTRAKHEATVYPPTTKYLIAFIGLERWNEENLSVLTTEILQFYALQIKQFAFMSFKRLMIC